MQNQILELIEKRNMTRGMSEMHVKMASVGGTAVLRGTEGMADFSVERNFER